MGAVMKLAGLTTVFAAGSLLVAWLAFAVENVPFAMVALAATGAAAVGWIVLIVRAEQVQR